MRSVLLSMGIPDHVEPWPSSLWARLEAAQVRKENAVQRHCRLSGTTTPSAADSLGRLDGEKLPVPYRDETRREIGIGFDESYERCHLLRVRRRVIDNEQSTRP